MQTGRHRRLVDFGRWSLVGAGLLLASLLVAGLCTTIPAAAQSALPRIDKSAVDRQSIRDNHIGIVTGSAEGIYAKMGEDLRRLLDDRTGQSLRVAVQLGLGSVGNLDDLRNLPGVSFAIVQGDVLEAYAADAAQYASLQQNIRYVSRLHTEVLHVVTRRDVIKAAGSDICALRRRRINVGGLSSGTAITVRKVFNELLGLDVTLDPASSGEAVEQLARREVDAIAYVVGRRASFFDKPDLAPRFNPDGFEWLAAPAVLFESGCGQKVRASRNTYVYEPTTLSNADYPQLIAPDTTIASIGVPAILAAYRFDDPNSARSRATGRFIERFFARAADGLGRPGQGYNINWCNVDLGAAPRSWQLHEAAAAALSSRPDKGASLRISCAASPPPLPAFCNSDPARKAEFDARRRRAGQSTAEDVPYWREFTAFEAQSCAAAAAAPKPN
jgi:TRAP-type uncharacterized transport system substrate-binding protein